MPRFECQATITFGYIVTAASEEEAKARLTEALGPDWENQCSAPDVEHPQIEEGPWGGEIMCLGTEEELEQLLTEVRRTQTMDDISQLSDRALMWGAFLEREDEIMWRLTLANEIRSRARIAGSDFAQMKAAYEAMEKLLPPEEGSPDA
jgi:hypothetical protein